MTASDYWRIAHDSLLFMIPFLGGYVAGIVRERRRVSRNASRWKG